jgi:AcrR family transcriptional regulator
MSADTKEKILAAASELFLEGGAAALSVRAISKRAGLSTIGIYSHFKGKQGILDELYIEGFRLVSEALAGLNFSEGGRAAIIQATNRYCDMAENHRAHYKLIFGEGDTNYEPSEDAKLAGRQSFELLVNTSAQALPENATRPEKQEFALGLWALIHGFVTLQHHAVNNLMESSTWRDMIQRAVLAHLETRTEALQGVCE